MRSMAAAPTTRRTEEPQQQQQEEEDKEEPEEQQQNTQYQEELEEGERKQTGKPSPHREGVCLNSRGRARGNVFIFKKHRPQA